VPPAIPLATYRLQLTKDFGFDAAARLVPYLKSLGISHLYASPFLKARPGSRHGYDIVDHNALNPELGGEQGFERLSVALRDADLGLILDFVPNHMAVGNDNEWWLDVLEWGRKSRHASSFDIAWEMLPYRHGGGVLLPVLGRPYGDALTAGEIELRYDPDAGSFSACYFENRFPINPQRYSDILKTIVAAADAGAEPAGRALLEFADRHSRPWTPSYERVASFKRQLAGVDGARGVIERGLKAYRSDGNAGTALLHRLLERQHYRLAYWRLAPSAINYRRFFDINELAGVRVEDAGTFGKIHRLVARLIAAGRLDGLRLDHIDGLFDPLQYTRRLQQLIREARGSRRTAFYVVVEKILEEEERPPSFAGAAGTTGYEILNTISRVLVHEPGRQALAGLWRDIAPEHADFGAVLERSKNRVLNSIMASEFNVLAQSIGRIAAGHFTTRDYAPDRLREALALYVLEFPIYRTYVTLARCRDEDRSVIDRTIAAARRRWHGTDVDIFDFLRDAITLDLARKDLPYSRTRLQQFALKLQQFTGPMMAKSLEDTALYRYHSLIGLNEVGGHPTTPGLSIAAFHAACAERAKQQPHGLTATATHDTKRGEDARTRILALSELPELWTNRVAEWRGLNARFVSEAEQSRTPSAGHEYMLYQALIGAWPLSAIDADFAKRMEEYAIKAAREGKLETSWINPSEAYEKGLVEFVRTILDPDRSAEFLSSFDAFARRMALIGAQSSLTQLVLKATIPGIPDFYQGCEFWDLSLVDPDNRRPVDFAMREQVLETDPEWRDLTEHWTDGRIKLALMRRLLSLRREHPALFRDGGYEPVGVEGADADSVLAFTRSRGRELVLVAVGRHFARMTQVGERWSRAKWQAELQLDRTVASRLSDAIGSAANDCGLDVSRLFANIPVAILLRD
jgi:(1->4)-alpha-D-glucan 1-alpha-D-glucosylmutase